MKRQRFIRKMCSRSLRVLLFPTARAAHVSAFLVIDRYIDRTLSFF
jgi:hypothetical protein